MRASAVSVSKPLNVTPSDDLLISSDAEVSNTNQASFIKEKEIMMNIPGLYRVTYEARADYTGAVMSARTYVNGVGRGTQNSTLPLTYTTTYSDDITVKPGDLVQLYLKSAWTGKTSFAKNFRVKGIVGNDTGIELTVP